MAVAVAMVVGLARPSEAAVPTSGSTFDIPLTDTVDRGLLTTWVTELNGRNPLLSDTLQEELDRQPVELPGGVSTQLPDFDGSFAVTGSRLTITIEPGEVHTDAEWWVAPLISFAIVGTMLLVRAACIIFIEAYTGAAAGLVGTAACSAMYGAFTALFVGIANIFLAGKQHDWRAWAILAGAVVLGAVGGAAWDGLVKPWAVKDGLATLRLIGNGISRMGQAIKGWSATSGGALIAAGNGVAENAPGIQLGILEGGDEARPEGLALRVLPLGDSITYGVGTSDNSSYRGRLFSLLDDDASDLDFVGSQRNGTLADNNHEGHPGWTISQINSIAPCTIRTYTPNIVTLHIGTNDMARNISVASAPDRLRNLIAGILAASPNTAVMVATLIPSTNPAIMNRIQQYNAAIPGVVNGFRAAGRGVHLVDMGAVTPGDMTDSLHPNANGYRKMADAFNRTIDHVLRWDAMSVVQPAGFFVDACDGATDNDGGTSDSFDPTGDLNGDWVSMGVVASGAGPREEVRFADLNGDGRDDYLLVSPGGRVNAWFNVRKADGGVSWQSMGEVASGSGPREGVRFADINGDGRDDYLVVGTQGQLDAWLNVGSGNGVSWSAQGRIAAGSGPREQVRFADINGDGRDDYLLVNGQGQVQAWFNNRGPGGTSWGSVGVVATGVGATADQVRFTDLNGDTRDDYLTVSAQGEVRAWLNIYGGSGSSWLAQGAIATGVTVARDALEFADLDGGGSSDYLAVNETGKVTAWRNQLFGDSGHWAYQGVVATGVGATLEEVRFADLNGDRRDDYLVVSPGGGVRAWLNNRGGSPVWDYRGQVAGGAGPREGVRFADINGDGRDDYLVVGAQGQVDAWLNTGTGNNVSWQAKGQIAAGSGARGDIRFGDVNGDGRDDYLVVGAQGQVNAWHSTGDGSTVAWSAQGQIAGGVGLPGSMITFADLDGDRRDDYLAVNDQGRIWSWLNRRGDGGGSWAPQGEVGTGVGATRNQLTLGDYNGDRRDDYLVTSATGAVTAWTNNGLIRKG